MFENLPASSDGLLGPGTSTPLTNSPHVHPSSSVTLSPTLLPIQATTNDTSNVTPSPVIDLDSGAATQLLRPISPAPNAMSPGDVLQIPPTQNETSPPPLGRTPPFPHTHPANEEQDIARLKPSVTEPLAGSGRLVPGSSLAPPPQVTHQISMPNVASTAKLSPSHLESRPMSRARSHSDQHAVRQQQHGLQQPQQIQQNRPRHQLNQPSLVPDPTPPLARRVRSATTLRQPQTTEPPLKAVIVNKQQQMYKKISTERKGSADGAVKQQRQETSDSPHRRSISADNSRKVWKAINLLA
ncbi:hypothetical protein BCR43DRAFT_206939 [Syncephalastrum racemosum]|uniref:Uncharacterized protein n=1 Tax=Syncephalastrum racemosum TaxID=13706 RepID=A0A1X2HI52_SYNRA|nr:hypothetical protein BCR43DRAFT_206939 [Syncephalastrum racemosum]